MKREIITKASYKPSKGKRPVGISQTVPRLSLSVSELVKRFTLSTLKEMEAKSLLNYDFGPDVTEDPFALLDKIDLSASSCIDITDVVALKELALAQLEEFRAAHAKEIKARKEASERSEGEAKEKVIKEAMARLKADGIKIE